MLNGPIDYIGAKIDAATKYADMEADAGRLGGMGPLAVFWVAFLAVVEYCEWFDKEFDSATPYSPYGPGGWPVAAPPGTPALVEIDSDLSFTLPSPTTYPAVSDGNLGTISWELPRSTPPLVTPSDVTGYPRTWDGGLHIESAGKSIGGFTPGVTEGSHPVLGSVLDFVSTEKGLISIRYNHSVGDTGMWEAVSPADNPFAIWVLPDITQTNPDIPPIGKFIDGYTGDPENWFVTAL